MKNYKFFQKVLFAFAIIFSLYFLTSSEVKAACGATICAWNGFPNACGGSGQCVSTQAGANCNWGGSTCYCPGVVGCTGGGACTNGSANCSALSQMYLPAAGSCCSGPAPTPAPTVPGATPTPTPPSCPTQTCGCGFDANCDNVPNGGCPTGTAHCCPKRPSSCGGGGGNQTPIGYHDQYSGLQGQAFCSAAGWSTDPDDTSKKVNVRIMVDGNANPLVTIPADQNRGDLTGVCPGGNCAFNFNFYSAVSHDIAHTITVQAQDAQQPGTWVNLSNTPKSLTCCSAVTAPTNVTPNSTLACGTTSTTIRWDYNGAQYYSLRVDDLSNPWSGNCAALNPGDTCADVIGTSYTVNNLTPGHSYHVWVHSRNSCGDWSATGTTDFTILSAVNLTQSPVGNISSGGTATFTASLVPAGAAIDSVSFNSSDTTNVTINPASDTTSPYTTTATGISSGISNITATAIDNGVNLCTSNTAVATVGNNVTGWWQVNGGDVIGHGNIRSLISTTCSGACTPIFNLKGAGGNSGLNIFSGTSDYSVGAGGGTGGQASNWNVNSVTDTSSLTYASFKGQLPQDVIAGTNELVTDIAHCSNPGGGAGVACSGQAFTQVGSPVRGYYWYHYDGAVDGDLTLKPNGGSGLSISGGKKIVLMVENANFIIDAKAQLGIPGTDFFMVVAGKKADGTKGNIIIDPSVGSANATDYAVQGIYFAENQIQTGAGANFLSLQGSFIGQGGVSLQRTLVDNAQSPAERFEYSAPLFMAFPQVLSKKKLQWQELAP